jgi:hypothetical protein
MAVEQYDRFSVTGISLAVVTDAANTRNNTYKLFCNRIRMPEKISFPRTSFSPLGLSFSSEIALSLRESEG